MGEWQTFNRLPGVADAKRAVGAERDFKMINDEETRRALFPSNYPPEESSCPARTWRVEND
jgi:GSH-dependent disulfide-bond oxidoreductase